MRKLMGMMLAMVVSAGAWGLDTKEELVRLDTHLEKIRKEYEFGRLMGGSTLVGIGGVIGVGGTVAMWSATQGIPGEDVARIRNLGVALSWTYGGLFLVPGALVLALKSDYETMPELYANASSATDVEAEKKVIRGEVTLQSLADKGRFDRLMSAGVMGLAGAGSLYLALQGPSRTTFSASNPALAYGVLYLGAGVLRALLESTPENENRAYWRWKNSN